MPTKNLLTDRKCRTALPKESLYYLNDGDGLRLRVRPDGSKNWIFRFRVHGRESAIGLGAFPNMPLDGARRLSESARADVQAGLNPATQKRLKTNNQSIENFSTFKAIGDEWLEHNKSAWSQTHYERNEGLLRRLLYPSLGKLPISSITESVLLRILNNHYKSGIKESARRARGCASQIFAYAKATHRAEKNPGKELSDNIMLKRPKVKHFAALPQESIGLLMIDLHKTGIKQQLDLFTVTGLLMALYTGLRDHSIRGAKWAEIDFEKSLWTVPAERMKLKVEHQVPLPRQALEALKRIHPLSHKTQDSFIFFSRSKTGYMAENTLRLALHRLGYKVTAHGFRSLMTDVLNENGFHPDAIERQLQHTEKNRTRAAYLRSNFMDERKKMIQWYADWCDAKAYEKNNNNVFLLSQSNKKQAPL